jgi:hypothetical protein
MIMCLQAVEKSYPKNSNFGFGYKVLRKKGEKYYSPNQRTCVPYRNDRWNAAAGDTQYASSGTKYQLGFHIFLNKADAAKYRSLNCCSSDVICMVRYKEVTTIGINEVDSYNYGDCVIAKKMFIEKEVAV